MQSVPRRPDATSAAAKTLGPRTGSTAAGVHNRELWVPTHVAESNKPTERPTGRRRPAACATRVATTGRFRQHSGCDVATCFLRRAPQFPAKEMLLDED